MSTAQGPLPTGGDPSARPSSPVRPPPLQQNGHTTQTKSEEPPPPRRSYIQRVTSPFLLTRDYRASLPPILSRFTGYKQPGSKAPYETLPFPPFTWLTRIPLQYEVYLFGWIGSFGGILLIEAIMSAHTAFHDIYDTPIIITSFGASAVLIFGLSESPLAQPRNFVLGHFISALVGTCITRLWVLDRSYQTELETNEFSGNTFVNGALSMATALTAMALTGTIHPPAGATALNAAVQSAVVTVSWRYLPTILASALVMLGWALMINNLGRRRYPLYWWAPGKTFVKS